MPLRFQAGGTIQDGAFYIQRPADAELLDALLRGELCFILGPRQIGKSSLRAKTVDRLKSHGVRCATVDLAGIGVTEVTADSWYFGLMENVASDLGLADPAGFWSRCGDVSPVDRWSRFLREGVLAEVREPIVVFIDEIGCLMEMPFARNDLCRSLLDIYDLRAGDPVYTRLNFCLLGVASLTDLVPEASCILSSAGRRICLRDFTREQGEAFFPGLADLGGDPHVWLDAVFDWTDGHPYMTQYICREITDHRQDYTGESDPVASIVEKLFLRRGRIEDSNLAAAEDYLQSSSADREPMPRALQMLRLYRRLVQGERICADQEDPIHARLRLAGMAAEAQETSGTVLKVRNRIFATVFNLQWIAEKESEMAPPPAKAGSAGGSHTACRSLKKRPGPATPER